MGNESENESENENINKRVNKNFHFSVLFTLLCLSLILSSCNEHAPAAENATAQITALSQAKSSQLDRAVGNYRGNVHMIRSNRDFACILNIKRVVENVRGSQPDQLTIEVPKLTAKISFPELDQNETTLNNADLQDLKDAMGFYSPIIVDYGNFNPETNFLSLPYSVALYPQGPYGDFSGILESNFHFMGTWFAKPLGDVATFDLQRTTSK